MKDLRIYIKGQETDYAEELRVTVSKIVSEYRNPVKKTGSFSYTIKLPVTQKNKKIFDYQNDRQVIGKFRTSYPCTVTLSGLEVLVGEFVLNKIGKSGFEGFISGSSERRLADLIDPDKKLRDIQSFSGVAFEGDKTVWEYLDKELDADSSDIAFPYVFDSFARTSLLNEYAVDGNVVDLMFYDFGVSHFARNVFTKIFTDAGYTVQGEILNSDTFKRLLLLYSNEQDTMPYNYARLNPLISTLAYAETNAESHIGGDSEDYDYEMYAFTPKLDTLASGDLSFSLSEDGTYFCQYTSDYTLRMGIHSYAKSTASIYGDDTVECKQYLLFREIDDLEFSEGAGKLPKAYNEVDFVGVRDYATLNRFAATPDRAGNTYMHQIEFTARLEAGKRYAPQIYTFIPKSGQAGSAEYGVAGDVTLIATTGDSYFYITEVAGAQDLQPALFLPDMSQLTFLEGIFKMFSLFYTVQELQKTVTLYTRDEFYELNKGNILDLSGRLSLDQFEETPFTESEIAETYFKWAADESDHLLTHTDYLTEVNGAEVPEGAFELPFAPLAFLKVNIYKNLSEDSMISYVIGSDTVPAAIPATDSVDARVLTDFNTSSNHSYKPKMCLYVGSGFLKPEVFTTDKDGENPFLLTFHRTSGLTSDIQSGDTYYKHLPRVTFFDLKSQPAYEIDIDQTTRAFTLTKTVGEDIITKNHDTFILTGVTTEALNTVSLANQGGKSLFQRLYRNDLAVADWSNFYDGRMRMTAPLFSQLTGRNILRIEGDLYLLSEIKDYDLLNEAARVRLYRMVNATE